MVRVIESPPARKILATCVNCGRVEEVPVSRLSRNGFYLCDECNNKFNR